MNCSCVFMDHFLRNTSASYERIILLSIRAIYGMVSPEKKVVNVFNDLG